MIGFIKRQTFFKIKYCCLVVEDSVQYQDIIYCVLFIVYMFHDIRKSTACI